MEGMERPSHRIQGGSHGQYSRSAPHAFRSETAPATTPWTALDPRETPATAPHLRTPTGQGATTRKWPPRGAFLIPRPLGVVGYFGLLIGGAEPEQDLGPGDQEQECGPVAGRAR